MFSKRNKIFLLFTFGLTWLAWWTLAFLTQQEIIGLQDAWGFVLFVLGGSAPTIGAYIAVAKTKEVGDVKEFNQRVFKVKVNYRYYLYAFFVPILIGIVGLFIGYMQEVDVFSQISISSLWLILPAFISAIIFGGIEEFGWRGILQAELTKKYSFLVSNFVIGFFWAFWHLPFFYMVGTSHFESMFIVFLLGSFGYSAFMTFLYARSESVFLCVIFHAMINATATVGLSIPLQESFSYLLMSFLMIIVGFTMLFYLDKQNQTQTIDNAS